MSAFHKHGERFAFSAMSSDARWRVLGELAPAIPFASRKVWTTAALMAKFIF